MDRPRGRFLTAPEQCSNAPFVLSRCSPVPLFATPWTAAHHAPLSMCFSREQYWHGLPLPSSRGSSRPRDRTHICHVQTVLTGGFFTTSLPPGKQSSPRDCPSFCIYFRDMWELTKTQFNLAKDWSPPYPTSEMFVLTAEVKWSLRSLSNLGGCDSNFKVLMAPIVFSQWMRVVRSAGVYDPWL